jgi:hypothetical protein
MLEWKREVGNSDIHVLYLGKIRVACLSPAIGLNGVDGILRLPCVKDQFYGRDVKDVKMQINDMVMRWLDLADLEFVEIDDGR